MFWPTGCTFVFGVGVLVSPFFSGVAAIYSRCSLPPQSCEQLSWQRFFLFGFWFAVALVVNCNHARPLKIGVGEVGLVPVQSLVHCRQFLVFWSG
mmetsp:Transcript_108609/g.248924  ORF Transcript_108609/g.248924 Transcript_108609/m.248924 type:complete len:95 (+) Transcript_108609:231-515(+)